MIRMNRGTPRAERMYDFYFSNYFAYYICKDKGKKKKQARAWSIPESDIR